MTLTGENRSTTRKTLLAATFTTKIRWTRLESKGMLHSNRPVSDRYFLGVRGSFLCTLLIQLCLHCPGFSFCP